MKSGKKLLRGILTPLVTVEGESISDLFLCLRSPDRAEDQFYRWMNQGTEADDVQVVQISDDGQIQESLSRFDVGNVRDPLLIGPVGKKVPVQRVRIAVKRGTVCMISLPADHREKVVLLHDTENGFGVVMYAVPVQPDRHPAIAVCAFTLFLTLPYQPREFFILRLPIHAAHKIVVPIARHLEEPAHLHDAELLPMTVYHPVFGFGFHFLSVSPRKSRSSSFSISSLLIFRS